MKTQPETLCFAIPGADSIIDTINPDTGCSSVYGESLENIRLRHPGAEIIELGDYAQQKAARQDTPITWEETTEEKYWEMLEVVPPAFMRGGAFLVGEPQDHHGITGAPRFAAYRSKGKRYFVASRPLRRDEMEFEMELPYPPPVAGPEDEEKIIMHPATDPANVLPAIVAALGGLSK